MKKVIHATIWLALIYGLAFFIILTLSIVFNVKILISLAGFEVIATILALSLVFSNRRYEVRLTWALVIILIPLFGLMTYLFLGRKYKIKPVIVEYHYQLNRDPYFANPQASSQKSSYWAFVENEFQTLVYKDNQVDFYQHSIHGYSQMIAELEKATKFILINYYIVEQGELFDVIFGVLKKKLKEGVKVPLVQQYNSYSE